MTINVLDDITAQIQHVLLVQVFTAAVVATATWLALSGGLFAVALLQFGQPLIAVEISLLALAITPLEGWVSCRCYPARPSACT